MSVRVAFFYRTPIAREAADHAVFAFVPDAGRTRVLRSWPDPRTREDQLYAAQYGLSLLIALRQQASKRFCVLPA